MPSPGFPASSANHHERPLPGVALFDRNAPDNNIAAICGTSHLTTGVAAHLVPIVLTLSMTPKMRRFVGGKLSVWVARGSLYVDGTVKCCRS